jgi:hypothetical protein
MEPTPIPVPLPLSCFAVSPPSPPLTPQQRAEAKRKHEERKEADRWYADFIQRAIAHEVSETSAKECRAREDELGQFVEHLLGEILEDEHVRTRPDDVTWQLYLKEFREFTAWAGELGIGSLPATGQTVALYLVNSRINHDTTHAALKLTAKAIEFVHEVDRKFLDRLPIAAALEWIRLLEIEIAKQKEADNAK